MTYTHAHTILAIDILPTTSGVPGLVEIVATLTDDTQVTLFSYYTDELTFTDDDLIGPTVDEARRLHHHRDVAWLKS